MAWTETVFTFGTSQTLNAGLVATGTATGIPSDGSSGVAVSYTPFPNATNMITLTLKNNPSSTGRELVASVDSASITSSGFTIYVTGGLGTEAASVLWKAEGS